LSAVKEELAAQAGGWIDQQKTDVANRYTDAENYFSSPVNGSTRGKELQEKVEKFESIMNRLFITPQGAPVGNRVKLNVGLHSKAGYDDAQKELHRKYHFKNESVIAAITSLTQFQNEVHIADYQVLTFLLNQISDVPQPMPTVAPIVRSPGIVKKGEEFLAEIYLSLIDTKGFEVEVDDQKIRSEDGRAVYKMTPTQLGRHPLRMTVTYKNGMGDTQTLITETEYSVVSEIR
jgi:hypothetical protein